MAGQRIACWSQLELTESYLSVVPCANQNLHFDGHSALAMASLLQLADFTPQNLQSLSNVQAVQVQQDHTCSIAGL